MNYLVRELEVKFVSLQSRRYDLSFWSASEALTFGIFGSILQGPDTSALSFRVGLHSGPITGGVLRGDNARFQLFGDVSHPLGKAKALQRDTAGYVSLVLSSAFMHRP
jgi:hypothetical protein